MTSLGTLDLAGLPHHELRWYFEQDGAIYSDRFPGAIFHLVPGYWVATRLGIHAFSLLPSAATTGLVTAAAALVPSKADTQVLPTARAVWVATVFTGLVTGAWSLAAYAPWSHTLNLLLVALALLALNKDSWLIAGLSFGLAVATRTTMAVAALAVGVALALAHGSLTPQLKVGVGCVPGVALLFIYNGLLSGRSGPSNGHELRGEVHVRWADLPLNVMGALLSPTRGAPISHQS